VDQGARQAGTAARRQPLNRLDLRRRQGRRLLTIACLTSGPRPLRMVQNTCSTPSRRPWAPVLGSNAARA
jgi:hypothetical protein